MAEWMYADVAQGALGFNGLAFLNPLRWSGPLSLEEAISQLEALSPEERCRPVNLKIPPGVFTREVRCESAADAVAQLRRTQAKLEKNAQRWAVELTGFLCAKGEEHRFEGKAPLLDVSAFSSVQHAVDRLNVDGGLCPGGVCVVYSKRVDGYVLAFRADKRAEAKAAFGLGPLSWREFAQRCDAEDGYRFGDLTRGLVAHLGFLGEVFSPRDDRFDGRKLMLVRGGRLGDRYDELCKLGAGAQGTASLMRRKRTGQEYVAKKATGAARDGLRDMKAELGKMQVLRHPRCVKMVEFLESPQEAVTVCEFAQHGDLGRYLSRERPADAIVAGIFEQAMAGVAFLHSSGCVHNDLKPENLLVFAGRRDNQSPRIAISDFGCARFEKGESRLRFGDPRYMAPENVRAMMEYRRADAIVDVELRRAGDVWSMGVTLFEMLSAGVVPFLYERCSLRRVQEEEGLFERLQECITSPDEVDHLTHCASPPPRLAALLPSLLDKTEDRRPTAQQVLAVLKEEDRRRREGADEQTALRSTRVVHLSVQQHRACQILLNCMMWRLQSQHVDALYEVFECFNPSNSGRISREEFQKGLEQYSGDASQAEHLFDEADIDGDGTLEFNEFAAITFDWGSMNEGELDKHIQELLEDLSTGGTGAVTRRELKEFLAPAVGSDELRDLFFRINTDSKDCIEAPDLRNFLRNSPESALPPVECRVPVL
mmetsp:Transcript_51724/g.160474  ORF Transcript_51724/g.160474 Transcript_51724/m.160474 type:complete len:711 (-) Transcript_51724:79-2211(-)